MNKIARLRVLSLFVFQAIFILFSPLASAQAASDAVVIKQLRLDRQRLVVSGGSLKEGADLMATFKDGKQCPLKIVKAKGNLASVDTAGCDRASELVVGQKLEASVSINESGPTESQRSYPSRTMKLGFSAFYDTANSISISGTTTYKNQSYSVSGSDSTTGTPGLGVSLQHRLTRMWGLEEGLTYEFSRSISSYNYTANGNNISGTSSTTFSEFGAQANGRYFPINNLYVFLGANVVFESVSGSDFQPKTGFGGQAGVGYEITDAFSGELGFRYLHDTGTGTETIAGSTASTTFDKLDMMGVVLLFRYSLGL